VSRSTQVTAAVGGRELTLSNLDKVLYPATGFTKGQVIGYYSRVAEVMLPHLADRPLTMKRYPDGVEGQSFFEKHAPRHAPAWVRRVEVPSSEGATGYSVVEDLPSLVWAANLAAIEFHVPLWHVGRRRPLPARPDHLVFDLDPGPGTSVVECCQVARLIAAEMEADPDGGIYSKTSGSKGLQLYLPVGPRSDWERQRTRAHDVAVGLEQSHPAQVVSNMRKSLRPGKVLIDWSQNQPSKTTVAAYSLRGRAEPTVSTPVTWDEVEQCADAGDPDLLRFTADQVVERVEELGDLFGPLGR
jgi:bifunctional non-homologous end joining protein LigD